MSSCKTIRELWPAWWSSPCLRAQAGSYHAYWLTTHQQMYLYAKWRAPTARQARVRAKGEHARDGKMAESCFQRKATFQVLCIVGGGSGRAHRRGAQLLRARARACDLAILGRPRSRPRSTSPADFPAEAGLLAGSRQDPPFRGQQRESAGASGSGASAPQDF